MSWAIIAGAIITAGAVVGAILAIKKAIWNPIRGWFSKINRAMDSLLGYPAVLDPGTGDVVQEATPMLSKRVKAVEEAVLALTETTKALTDWALRLDALERQVATILNWQKDHDALHTIMAETKAASDHSTVVVNTGPATTENT